MRLPQRGEVYVHMGYRLRVYDVDELERVVRFISHAPNDCPPHPGRCKESGSYSIALGAFMDHIAWGLLEQDL